MNTALWLSLHLNPALPPLAIRKYVPLQSYPGGATSRGTHFCLHLHTADQGMGSLPPPDDLNPDQVKGCTFSKQAVTVCYSRLLKVHTLNSTASHIHRCELYFKSNLLITVGICEDTTGRDHLAGKLQDLKQKAM